MNLYFDQNLIARSFLLGKNQVNDGDLCFGGGCHFCHMGVIGAGLDNFQIFNKALTADEITVIALANKDIMTD